MKVIRPVTITDAELISSSVPETEYPAYNPSASYAVGYSVIYEHVIYECLQEPNVGNPPDSSPIHWAPKGPTNRWLMFDNEVSTKTEAEDSIVVTIAPGMVDSFALIDVTGFMANVVITDGPGGPELYNRNYPLDGSEVFDWFQYFYQPFIEIHQVVLTDLPLYGSAHITATITSAGTVKVGSMIAGTAFELGGLQYGATAGIISFSKKETDPVSGDTTFVRRRNSKRMNGQLWFENWALNNIFRVLESLDATPCVWVGTDSAGYEPLIIFGFYRDFSIVVAYPTVSLCDLEIEGMV